MKSQVINWCVFMLLREIVFVTDITWFKDSPLNGMYTAFYLFIFKEIKLHNMERLDKIGAKYHYFHCSLLITEVTMK